MDNILAAGPKNKNEKKIEINLMKFLILEKKRIKAKEKQQISDFIILFIDSLLISLTHPY